MSQENHKASTKAAMDRWLVKNDPLRVKRKNKAPERDVALECVQWLRANGFSGDVVESKAVYSQANGRYLRGQTVEGFPDWVGCTNFGHGAFVEFKAKGKIKTVRPSQHKYLSAKIECGAFAVAVDSADMLRDVYFEWHKLWCHSHYQARKLLAERLGEIKLPTSDDFF